MCSCKNIEQNHPIDEFQNLFRSRLAPQEPVNRYQGVKELAQAIQKKKGAYKDDERRDWLKILYACLAAPDCYFTQYPIQGQYSKKVQKFEAEQLQIQQMLDTEKIKVSAMYTHLDSIRDYMRTPIDQIKERHPLAQRFQNKVSKALKMRIEKYPSYANYENKYQETLSRIFCQEQERLNHPMFFLFLPYYVFFELAKCEGAIERDENAFAIPQLNSDNLNWTIRRIPFRCSNPVSINRLMELYTLVESALCSVLRKQKYHTMGRAALHVSAKYSTNETEHSFNILRACSRFFYSAMHGGDITEERTITEDAIAENAITEGTIVEDAIAEEDDDIEQNSIFFSAPIWKYDEWAKCLEQVFRLEKVGSNFKDDLQQLFSLTFRVVSWQSETRVKDIYDQYATYTMQSRKQLFRLPELMAALSKIYNANYLTNADPFQGQELQSAVNLLSEFMIAIRYWDNEIEGLNTTDKRWLDLLAFGYDGKDNDDDDDNVFSIENYDKFFINPSRVLVQTIFLHSLAKEYKGNIQEDRQLQNYFEAAVFDEDIKTPIKMIREKIYKSLSSPKELFNDIAFWGGIKIAEGDIAKIMTEVRLWSFWREQESAIFGQIVADIKRKPACLQNFLQQLKMTCTNPNVLELYISDYQKAPEEIKSKRLEKYKMQIILALPENVLKELKKLGKNDDISAYMGIAKAIQKEYGGLDQLVSRLKAIGSDCPKIKLKNFTFAEVIAKISTMVDGKSENLDVNFLPKSKQELLETLKAEERIKEYNDKIVELEKSLIWLDSLFKFIKKMYLNHLKYGLAIKAFVK